MARRWQCDRRDAPTSCGMPARLLNDDRDDSMTALLLTCVRTLARLVLSTGRPAEGTGPIMITADGRWIRQDGTDAA